MSTALATANGNGNGTMVGTGGAVAVVDAMSSLKSIRTFVSNELVDTIDYGLIPGTGNKKVLLLPGAQKVAMYLNVYPEYAVQPHELGSGHVEYVVETKLVFRGTGDRVGSGIGSCSTMEGKYRYRTATRTCPACGKESIIKGKEEYGGGWVCFAKKGGCGAKFPDGDRLIEAQPVGKAENENIYDMRNTVLKMAKKRSLVDASIGLACLADQFTQDIEDIYDLSATPATESTPAATPPTSKAREDRPSRDSVNNDFPPAQNQQRTPSAPRTGKALFAWTKEHEQKHEVGILRYINGWAKLQEFPNRMTDWDADQVARAFAELQRKIAAIGRGEDEPAQAQQATRPTSDPFDGMMDEAVAAWEEFEPSADDKARVEKRHRLINQLASWAIDDERLKKPQISKTNDRGNVVRDAGLAWDAIRKIFYEDAKYLEESIGMYLGEKRDELAAAVATN